MKIIILGDIFGKVGRDLVRKELSKIKEEYKAEYTIANVENTTHGKGISLKHYEEMNKYIDFMTSGNHIFNLKETENFISITPNLLRPLNSNPYHPGKGSILVKLKNKKVRITNLIGTGLMSGNYENPFFWFEKILKEEDVSLSEKSDIHLVDFHAETTSEKINFANYYDGKITAFWGTHTHVQTNDDRILKNGTAFITDIGMTGNLDGIIGANPEVIIKRSKYGLPSKMMPYYGGIKQINGIFLEIDEKNNSVIRLEKIRRLY